MTTVRRATAGLAIGGVLLLGSAPAGAIDDTITVDPDSGPVGQQVDLDGTISCPDQTEGTELLVRFIDPDAVFQTGTNLGFTTYGAGGAFSTTVTVPAEVAQLILGEGITPVPVTPGSWAFLVQCTEASGTPNDVTGPFTVTASPTTTTPSTTTPPTTAPGGGFTPPASPPAGAAALTGLSSTTVRPGGTVTVDQAGYTPGSTAHVVLYSSPVVLATVTVGGDGHARATVTVPAGTAPGPHTLVVYGDPTPRSTTLTVLAAGAPARPAAARPNYTG